MNKEIPAKINGFTPLFENLLQEHDVMTAAVYGRMWRYCQGERGKCTASIETIAKELHTSRMTVTKHIHILEQDGYLEDLTPDRRNAPHEYADTGKAKLRAEIIGEDGGVKKLYTSEEGVKKLDTGVKKLDTEVSKIFTAGCKESLHEDRSEDRNKERIEDINDDKVLVSIFRDVTGFTPDYMNEIRVVQLLHDILKNHPEYDVEGLKAHLKKYADNWKNQRSKTTGRRYSIRNFAWLEQAAADELVDEPNQPAAPATTGPNGGMYV